MENKFRKDGELISNPKYGFKMRLNIVFKNVPALFMMSALRCMLTKGGMAMERLGCGLGKYVISSRFYDISS